MGRVLQVTAVAGRHGARCVGPIRRRFMDGPDGSPTAAEVVAEQFRDALADLGPTFIKLGQVLSSRPDLLPPAFEATLSTLQDSAPAVPFEAIEASVRTELGLSPEDAFSCFGHRPLAAASIGQVHPARLQDGRQVVVKVRRPGVEDLIELDLAILRHLAHLASIFPGPGRQFNLVGFVEEFGNTTRAELDYLAEGRNADRGRPRLAPLGVHVPEVVWASTTSGVITLERIYGAKIDDLPALDAMGTDRRQLARTLAESYLSMVFVDGFFHADPHPGNFFVEADGRLAMVDFGMMGTVAPEVGAALVEILLALTSRDVHRTLLALRELGIVPAGVDEQKFSLELADLTNTMVDVPVGEMRLAPLLSHFMTVSRRHRLRLPRELALLMKTIVMCEALAAQLDPTFSLALVMAPFVGAVFGATKGEAPAD